MIPWENIAKSLTTNTTNDEKIYSSLFISLFGFAQQTPASKQSKSILILGAKAHLGNGQVI